MYILLSWLKSFLVGRLIVMYFSIVHIQPLLGSIFDTTPDYRPLQPTCTEHEIHKQYAEKWLDKEK